MSYVLVLKPSRIIIRMQDHLTKKHCVQAIAQATQGGFSAAAATAFAGLVVQPPAEFGKLVVEATNKAMATTPCSVRSDFETQVRS